MKKPLENIEDLLGKVVLAVVEAGHASCLYEFPEVLAYFGAALPQDDDYADIRPWRHISEISVDFEK